MTDSPEQTPDLRTISQQLRAVSGPAQPLPRRRSGEWLRWIPPIAALGTAYVLQVVLVTDLLGEVLASRQTGPAWVWYTAAGLLGVAFASCVEGGAAYLMDLYDRHLLARDSVWMLRVGMVLYVAGSAALIHWWLSERGLPQLIAWALAAMSASALFLWSRGSRWRNRREMLAAGQIDPALPRLPLAAKLLHPIRTVQTLYLISWGQPVRTTDGARRRHDAWRRLRRVRKNARKAARNGDGPTGQTPAPKPAARVRPDPAPAATPDPSPDKPPRPKQTRRRKTTGGNVRTLRSAADDTHATTALRRWVSDNGRTPSLKEVQRIAGGGRSRAVRLRGLISDQTSDDQEDSRWAG